MKRDDALRVAAAVGLWVWVSLALPQHRAHRGGSAHHGQTPTQLKSRLRQIRDHRAMVQRKLRETKHKAHVVVEDIHIVDTRLERLEGALEDTADRLSTSKEEQRLLGSRLVEASKRLVEVREQVRHRLRLMYMAGDGTFLSVMAGTRTVDDLVSEHALLEAIARKDRRLFDEFTTLQREIANKKRRQDLLVNQIRSLKERQAEQQVALKDTRVQKAHVLGALREQESDLRRQMAQFDADESEISSEIAAFARRTVHSGGAPLPHFGGRFVRPAHGPITSGFGMRYHPILHYTRIHKGIDFGAPYGSPIVAAADGEVISARYSTSFGNVIIIAHGGNISTVYAHCSRMFVGAGQRVRQGQRIGAVGNTGLAKGPHLHWEVHVGGTAVNPIGRF